MATEYIYPNSATLTEIAQVLIPRLIGDRPIFQEFPFDNVDAAVVMWEQEDNYTGLQAARGLNGEPPKIKRAGMKRWEMAPGVYGEYSPIDEHELTVARQYGQFGAPMDISDRVMREARHLLERRLDRIEWILWTLLSTGTFAVPGPNGTTIATDTYPIQTYTASTSWATAATSTPLHDFRQVQLKHRGQSTSFYADAKAFMNLNTANNALVNTNNADLYGRRVTGLATVNSPGQWAQLNAEDNLPQPVIYDEGYLDDSGTFHPFIPDNTVVVLGKRFNAAPLGRFVYTRNANNPNAGPGPYMRVIDTADYKVPRSIEVHDGYNGGPAIEYPGSVVLMNV
jgi:hypothetical protein